jgi:putative addiction module component (TIGR02574 family)
MSIETILEAVRALPPDDQRLVAETILEQLDDAEPLTDVQKELLDHRLAAYRANPGRGRPFEEVLDRIEAELDR